MNPGNIEGKIEKAKKKEHVDTMINRLYKEAQDKKER